jgi:hypothetical protein
MRNEQRPQRGHLSGMVSHERENNFAPKKLDFVTRQRSEGLEQEARRKDGVHQKKESRERQRWGVIDSSKD